ncbi:MAG TPA: glycerol-3-phosphate dehydrogenase/oxidase [Tepidisphaeraceae bacterium]|nr:glycerol-3-phosphate dehydrogenase/oxidase [Tepidisphaeraceae bacterium]
MAVNMTRTPRLLADTEFDLLIIGGGIFGAGIARDAALRGLRVALVEQGDFASGTSSQSSKLIHGGFRYLEQFQIGLVAEALRERHILRTTAPHLVHPLPLILPVYAGDPRPLWMLRVGMKLYDLLAMYRNVQSSRGLSAADVLAREPALRPGGLAGGVRFFDAHEDDARLCLDTILHAAQLGAVCVNYCRAIGFARRDERVVAATVEDQLSHERFEVSARVFVNAAGPWIETVQGLAGIDGPKLRLSPTKGVHLVLPALVREHGIFFQSPRDGRMMFLLPWYDASLLGTTDTDFTADPSLAGADSADVEYLLEAANSIVPDAHLTPADVITTFAGVRPLLVDESKDPSARPREHRIELQGENFLSIGGGKYTTFRLIAAQATDRVCRILGLRRACRTAAEPLPNLRPPPSGEMICANPKVHASAIEHAVRAESATSVLDVMRRRTPLALTRFGDPQTAAAVGRIMAPVAGWTDGQIRKSLEEYAQDWQHRRTGVS